MDLETAIKFIDRTIRGKKGRKLRPPEVTIIRGTWQGITYEQMAERSEYSSNYLMRDIGPKFWRLLSEVLEVNVSKSNLRVVMEKLNPSLAVTDPKRERLPKTDSLFPQKTTLSDWGEAPIAPSKFYGREKELATLKQWILGEKSHSISIWGLSGVGKTTLMRKLAEQIQHKFEIVIWRSLALAPSLDELIAGLPDLLFCNTDSQSLLSQLIVKMRSHSCLILLDGVEAILEAKQLVGKYGSGYEDYQAFFRFVGEGYHQSCVVINSLENPGGIFKFTKENTSIRTLKLLGLSSKEGQAFFEAEQLNPNKWQILKDYYRGNPAALNIAIEVVKNLFNGNIEEFIEHKTFVFGEIEELIAKSFNRLSTLETEILYWLASEEKPVSLAKIQKSIPLAIYSVELLAALQSLSQRSLIETIDNDKHSLFVLPPMVKEFVTNQLIDRIGGSKFSFQERQQASYSGKGAIRLSFSKQPTNLNLWWQNRFELGWQSLETLFAALNKSPLRLRSTFHLRGEALIKRFKQIELGTTKSDSVLLVVAISKEEQTVKICVQVQPPQQAKVLPPQLKLSLLDLNGITLAEVRSQSQDNFIQLPYFWGERGEHFQIGIQLDSATYQEEFIL